MIWEEIMDYGKYCGLIKLEEYMPIYLCSIGAHIANFHNKGDPTKPPFHTTNAQPTDLRLHVLGVGPAGYGKSLYTRFFLEESSGLLVNAIPCCRQGKLTNKGLTGGYEGEERIIGEAERYIDGIIGIEEFDHVIQATKQEHSADMQNDFLDLLDSGWYKYRRGTQNAIQYQSFFSLWAGTQPERFEVGSGFARRIAFLDMSPDEAMRKLLFDLHYKMIGIDPNMKKIRQIRELIRFLWKGFSALEIEFTESYQSLANSIAKDHLEQAYLDKFAIGYHIVRRYRGGNRLIVYPDSELADILRRVRAMRTHCMYGLNELAVLKLAEKPMELTPFTHMVCEKLHVQYGEASKLVKSLLIEGAMSRTWEAKEGSKKKVQMIIREYMMK